MKARQLFVLLGGMLALSACNQVVGGLIPPQTIHNPAQLNGSKLATSGVLTVQKVVGSIRYDTSATIPPASFADLTFPDIPLGIMPHALSVSGSLKTAVLTGGCVAPDSFNLNVDSFSIAVWNSGNKAGAATLTGTQAANVTATKNSSSASGTVYTLSANSLNVNADRSVTDQAIAILTAGGTNDASASAQISADNNALAGCQLTFTLDNTSATFSNFD